MQRVNTFCRIVEFFKEEESPLLLKYKKKKKVYKTELKVNQVLNLYVSVIMTLVSVLVWISVPFGLLESPCELFQQKEMDTMYTISKFLYRNITLLDILIIVLIVLLTVVSIDTVYDAIKNTDISQSPWVLRGKYVDLKRNEKTTEELWNLYMNEINYIYSYTYRRMR